MVQREPERVRQAYSYAQTELPANLVTMSLNPKLDHTPLNQRNAQVNSSHAAATAANRNKNTSATQRYGSPASAQRTENTATPDIGKREHPSPAPQTSGHNQNSAALKSRDVAAATTQTNNTASANPFAAKTTGAAATSPRTENKPIAQAAQYNGNVSPAAAQTSASTKTVNPFAAQTTGHTSFAAPAAASPRTENKTVQRNPSRDAQYSGYVSAAITQTTANTTTANPLTAHTTGHTSADAAAASSRTDNKPIAQAAQYSGYVSLATAQTSANTMTVSTFAAQKAEYTALAAQRVASPHRSPRYTRIYHRKSSVTDESFVFINTE